jgi:hypothetical protein
MAMEVAGQVLVKFAVDGKELPLGIGSFLHLSIIENITNKLPTLKFVFNDPNNLLHDVATLTDSSKVTVVLHSDNGFDQGQPYEITFRIIGTKLTIKGARLLYTASGVYDSSKYLAGLVKKSYKGTSSKVIGQLAGECGLKPQTAESVSDSMSWLPNRITYSDFVHSVCDHGYASDKSIMSVGITDRGNLVYKNLETLAKASPVRLVRSGSPDQVIEGFLPCIGFEVTNLSGMNNFLYNYGLKLVQEKMEGTAEQFADYAASLITSSFLSMSSSIKDAVGGAVRSEYLPHDMGNQHKNYYKAEYQNRRGRQLFSNRIEFKTANSSGLQLYDLVYFEPILPTSNVVSRLLTGKYIVTAKNRYLAGNQYFEKIQIASQGYPENISGDLVGP